MGLLDFLKKQPDEKVLSVTEKKKEISIPGNAEAMLRKANADLSLTNATKIPFSDIASVGGVISSLIPALNKVSQSITSNGEGLYKWINAVPNAVLKTDKNGPLPFFIDGNGKSVVARFCKVSGITEKSTTLFMNPTTIMMAVTLAAINKKLDEIEKVQKQILSFLEQDKEAQIEGDLKTLLEALEEYKFNCDKESFCSNQHKLCMDIRRTAEQNIIFYRKQAAEVLKGTGILPNVSETGNIESSLQKKFRYYGMALYTYSFASYMEVMLLQNFQADFIGQVRTKVSEYADEYRGLFSQCREKIEKLYGASIEANALKGLGSAAKTVGNFIGGIPFVKDGPVDEWLVHGGKSLESVGNQIGSKVLEAFDSQSTSGSEIFLDSLSQIEEMYNQTTSVYFDSGNLYMEKALPLQG